MLRIKNLRTDDEMPVLYPASGKGEKTSLHLEAAVEVEMFSKVCTGNIIYKSTKFGSLYGKRTFHLQLTLNSTARCLRLESLRLQRNRLREAPYHGSILVLLYSRFSCSSVRHDFCFSFTDIQCCFEG